MSNLLTNAELATKFVDVVSRTSINSSTLKMARNQIANCPQSISEMFEQDGNLEKIKIPHLYQKFYPILEDILRDGIEKTSERVVKNDISKIRRNQFKGIPGSSAANVKPESTLPSWDDGVKN